MQQSSRFWGRGSDSEDESEDESETESSEEESGSDSDSSSDSGSDDGKAKCVQAPMPSASLCMLCSC